MYLLKILSWILAIIFLILGLANQDDDLWLMLIIGVGIDVPSTFLIFKELARKTEYGNVQKDIISIVKAEIRKYFVGEVDDSSGSTGLLKALNTSNDSRKDVFSDDSQSKLGSRIFFNHVWTFALLYVCWEAFSTWW